MHLDFFKRTPNLEKLILSQDVIFVGGGNTKVCYQFGESGACMIS